MQAQRRARLIAPDNYAEPVAGILRIIGTSLDGSILFAGKFGRCPRRCMGVPGHTKRHAPDEQAEHHQSHLTLSGTHDVRARSRRAPSTVPAENYQIVNRLRTTSELELNHACASRLRLF